MLAAEVRRHAQMSHHDWETEWPEKSPNVYHSCPNMISLEKWDILTPLQKLPNNERDLGNVIVAIGFKNLSFKSPYQATLPRMQVGIEQEYPMHERWSILERHIPTKGVI